MKSNHDNKRKSIILHDEKVYIKKSVT